MAGGIRVARSLRRTPPSDEVEGHDGNDGDPHAPVGLPHYEHDGSGASGGLGDYAGGGSDVYNGI